VRPVSRWTISTPATSTEQIVSLKRRKATPPLLETWDAKRAKLGSELTQRTWGKVGALLPPTANWVLELLSPNFTQAFV
jgi:hypothetical protein